MGPSKKSVAIKLRNLARNWSMTGTPDFQTATIADYVDSDCDYINRDDGGE